MNTNDKTFYTIMAITRPRLINNQYSAIASSHFLVKPPTFNFQSDIMADKLNTVYNNKLKIIIITNKFEKVETYKIGNSFTSNYTVFIVPSKEFYNKKLIDEAFLNNNYINHSIFMFENLDYREIVANLAMFNIIISGGSNSKKHILSPIQMRLARFIIAISSFSGSEIAESFHFERPSAKSGNNWTNKASKSVLSKLDDESKNEFIHHINKLDNQTNKIEEENNSNNLNPSIKSYSFNNNPCTQKREFHTFFCLRKEDNSSSISIVNPSVPLKAVPVNNNLISFYLNYIQDIINHPDLSPNEAQSKIENIWLNLIEEKLKDDNYLIRNHSSKLHSLIFEAHKTLEILEKRNLINRKFSELALNNKLNRIEFILLTFVWCITYSDRLSYTAIS
jgi:hypothetical protein